MKALLIGQFIEPPFSEGVVNSVLNWSKAVSCAGADIEVLSTSSKYSGHHKISGINFEYVKTESPRFQGSLLDLLSIQKEILRQSDFDVVHFAFNADGISSLPILAWLKPRHKIVNSYHTIDSHPTRLVRNFMFDMVTVPSKRMFKAFLEKNISPQKMRIIPTCVDENDFRPRDKFKVREELGLQQDPFIVFTIGHFRRGRLLIPLIKLVQELANEGKKIQILIGWTGQGEIAYINEIFSIAQDNRMVKIIPPTDKINLYYNASDIYVLSAGSNYVIETPLSLVEALSSGRPAIAFDINASSEIIKDGINGYIIKDENFAELKSRLSYVMNNFPLLKELSLNARNLAMNTNSYDRIGHQLLDLYSELVEPS